ncbi:hypothetical protein [Natronomonas moolapensis]|uniref:hypothetical protein n=1 Tax=Natronomonas moolapensis TaxID=416273 RepID=UPI00136233D4|nr:hypothetical protein [Natronomonas moolapensis]
MRDIRAAGWPSSGGVSLAPDLTLRDEYDQAIGIASLDVPGAASRCANRGTRV